MLCSSECEKPFKGRGTSRAASVEHHTMVNCIDHMRRLIWGKRFPENTSISDCISRSKKSHPIHCFGAPARTVVRIRLLWQVVRWLRLGEGEGVRQSHALTRASKTLQNHSNQSRNNPWGRHACPLHSGSDFEKSHLNPALALHR